MNSDQQTRVENAIDMGDVKIQPLPEGKFRIKDDYVVDPQEPSCECADHEYRNMDCKHIIRIWLELNWGNIEPYEESESEDVDRPPKPSAIEPDFESMPRLLKNMEHWVGWKFDLITNKDDTQRWTKVPINIEGGGFASSTDSATWTDFDTAKAYYERAFAESAGVGFTVSEDDYIVGIDIDDCRNPETGELVSGLSSLLDKVESYTEVSPSGTGIRIFVQGKWPMDENQSDNIAGSGTHFEVYEWGRYLTVTGHHIEGTPTDIEESEKTIELFADIMDPTRGLDTDDI